MLAGGRRSRLPAGVPPPGAGVGGVGAVVAFVAVGTVPLGTRGSPSPILDGRDVVRPAGRVQTRGRAGGKPADRSLARGRGSGGGRRVEAPARGRRVRGLRVSPGGPPNAGSSPAASTTRRNDDLTPGANRRTSRKLLTRAHGTKQPRTPTGLHRGEPVPGIGISLSKTGWRASRRRGWDYEFASTGRGPAVGDDRHVSGDDVRGDELLGDVSHTD